MLLLVEFFECFNIKRIKGDSNMPICKNCSSKFKNHVKIEGVWKNVSNRRYCLDCNPYGGGSSTHWIYNPVVKDTPRICSVCKKEYIYDREKGHRAKMCSSCKALTSSQKNRKKAVDHCGGKCQICGYSKTVNGLCFHHVDPRDKKFVISKNYTIKWESLKEEIDKCLLVCLVCHAEIHEGLVKIPKDWKNRK